MFGVRVQSKLFHTRDEEESGKKPGSYLDNEEDGDNMFIEDLVEISKEPLSVRDITAIDLQKQPNERKNEEAKDCNDIHMEWTKSDTSTVISDTEKASNTRTSTPKTPEENFPQEAIVECSCGLNVDDGMMILCDFCKHWQHACCYRFFTEQDCPTKHICITCAVAEKKECSDITLHDYDPKTLQTQCLWRRALVACRDVTRITAQNFSKRLGVELTVAQDLMKRMQNERFIRPAAKGKRLGKLVVKEKFTVDALKQYFDVLATKNDGLRNLENNENGEKPNDVQKDKENGDEKNNCENAEKGTNIITQNEEFESMLEKAKEINISGKNEYQKESVEVNIPEEKNSSRGRKRLLSSADIEIDFDVSNSQDPMDHCNKPSTKRMKASAAEQAVAVYV
ncbi:uncharacterized protein LOC124454785 [Xenia sp. Carnegie-2017]|uniref:uncharacterized protein LOC124454785 n=1 Tax=Xenia sp. Carnegie-2017 TaxID=2897299 RepID=UPI001F042A67|nr:uncharacterized protein LOC124454785 [Xenia sp. Carnegie-2017]